MTKYYFRKIYLCAHYCILLLLLNNIIIINDAIAKTTEPLPKSALVIVDFEFPVPAKNTDPLPSPTKNTEPLPLPAKKISPKYNFLSLTTIPTQYIHNDNLDKTITVGLSYLRKYPIHSIVDLYYGLGASYTFMEDNNSVTKIDTTTHSINIVPKVFIGIKFYKDLFSFLTGFGVGIEHQKIIKYDQNTKKYKTLRNTIFDGELSTGILFTYKYFTASVSYVFSTIAHSRGPLLSIGVTF